MKLTRSGLLILNYFLALTLCTSCSESTSEDNEPPSKSQTENGENQTSEDPSQNNTETPKESEDPSEQEPESPEEPEDPSEQEPESPKEPEDPSEQEPESPEDPNEPVTRPNDFSAQTQTYTEYIGTYLPVRLAKSNGENEVGSSHEETIEWILDELTDAGYSEEQIQHELIKAPNPWTGGTAKVRNIVLSVEGTDPTKQILVGAHYDGEGVGDNGSGVALLLATAVGLATKELPYTVKYIFFDGEEIGLVGSTAYAKAMTDEQIASTKYMINLDALAFGDYANVYGGVQSNNSNLVSKAGPYLKAMAKARALGIKTYETAALDGYYAAHGTGPELDPNALYTNPWTRKNPAPKNNKIYSPTTIDASDHVEFKNLGIPYIYFEATNWFAKGSGGSYAYTGYYETYDTSLGDHGMFMNTKYDTLDELNTCFPGRSLDHYKLYSPLLSSLLVNPDDVSPEP